MDAALIAKLPPMFLAQRFVTTLTQASPVRVCVVEAMFRDMDGERVETPMTRVILSAPATDEGIRLAEESARAMNAEFNRLFRLTPEEVQRQLREIRKELGIDAEPKNEAEGKEA